MEDECKMVDPMLWLEAEPPIQIEPRLEADQLLEVDGLLEVDVMLRLEHNIGLDDQMLRLEHNLGRDDQTLWLEPLPVGRDNPTLQLESLLAANVDQMLRLEHLLGHLNVLLPRVSGVDDRAIPLAAPCWANPIGDCKHRILTSRLLMWVKSLMMAC